MPCPHADLRTSPPPSDQAPLFRKPGTATAWPYHLARDRVLSALASSTGASTAVIKKVFGTHSLRKGGATAAGNKLRADKETVAMFLAHGGWRSKQAAAVDVKPPSKVAKAVGF